MILYPLFANFSFKPLFEFKFKNFGLFLQVLYQNNKP